MESGRGYLPAGFVRVRSIPGSAVLLAWISGESDFGMYGLIHRAVRDCVKSDYGEGVWSRIVATASLDDSMFVSMQAYPDEVTLSILGTASEELGEELVQLLHKFGRYWVLHTARKEYGPLFSFTGDNMRDFLSNLNAMHEHLAVSFANLRQPTFEAEVISDSVLHLHYESVRDGLTHFVLGLLSGLSEHFDEPVTCAVIEEKANGAAHDVFRLQFAS